MAEATIKTGTTRLSINISNETARALRALAEKHDTSVTNIVRRAVSVYSFLDKELEGDTTLQLIDRKSNETTNLALL